MIVFINSCIWTSFPGQLQSFQLDHICSLLFEPQHLWRTSCELETWHGLHACVFPVGAAEEGTLSNDQIVSTLLRLLSHNQHPAGDAAQTFFFTDRFVWLLLKFTPLRSVIMSLASSLSTGMVVFVTALLCENFPQAKLWHSLLHILSTRFTEAQTQIKNNRTTITSLCLTSADHFFPAALNVFFYD